VFAAGRQDTELRPWRTLEWAPAPGICYIIVHAAVVLIRIHIAAGLGEHVNGLRVWSKAMGLDQCLQLIRTQIYQYRWLADDDGLVLDGESYCPLVNRFQ